MKRDLIIYHVPLGRTPSLVLILAPTSNTSSTLWIPLAKRTEMAADAPAPTKREATAKAFNGMK